MNAQLLPIIAAEAIPGPGPTCGELSSAEGVRLPLKAVDVDTVIVGMTATSTVRQRFVNNLDTALEATYVFPLPARAGVTDFVADLAGRRVVGVLKERGEARADYEQALVSGQRAAIVEEDRSDVFSVRVGNLGPGEEATIEMRLTGPLAFEDGEATFRFPLVVAPRYTTGTPLSGDRTGGGEAPDTDAVPDASRVTPPRLGDGDERPDLQISLTVDGGGFAVSDLRSSLPTAVLDSDGVTRLELQPGLRADQDFILRFRVDRTELSSSALLVPDTEGDEGTWSVTLLPPAETSSAPRDVVVVLDRSGSMHGWKMIAARRAAGRIVDMLDTADRFCVIAFDDRVDTPDALPNRLVEATDRNRFAAASWLGSLQSRGGTEMAEPLRMAFRLLANADQGRCASVVLVTDGQISGEDHLLRSLATIAGRTRTYCVGIDRAVNAGFLDRLASMNSGRVELVESEDRLDEAMGRLARTIGRPTLTDVRVSADGVEIIDGTVTPGRAPDAFAGVPCVISGRYRGSAAGASLRVAADASTGPFAVTVPAKTAPEAIAVQTIWARSLVRDMEDDYASGRGDTELAVQLVAHSIRFGVLSRFTAFVAVDPERTDAGPLTEVMQPVEQPAGWAMLAAAAPTTGAFPMAAPMGAPPAAAGVPFVGTARHRRTAPEFDGGALDPLAKRMAPKLTQPTRPALKDVLKAVEKAVGHDETGLSGFLRQLEAERAATSDPALEAALENLCDALRAYVSSPSDAGARQVREAVAEVKKALKHVRAGRKLRFWE